MFRNHHPFYNNIVGLWYYEIYKRESKHSVSITYFQWHWSNIWALVVDSLLSKHDTAPLFCTWPLPWFWWFCLRMTPPLFTLSPATKVAPLSLVSIHSAIPGGCTNYSKLTSNVLVMTLNANFFLVITEVILTEVVCSWGSLSNIARFRRLRGRPPAIVHEKINTRPCRRLSADACLKRSRFWATKLNLQSLSINY
jgi:hypothetical protein